MLRDIMISRCIPEYLHIMPRAKASLLVSRRRFVTPLHVRTFCSYHLQGVIHGGRKEDLMLCRSATANHASDVTEDWIKLC